MEHEASAAVPQVRTGFLFKVSLTAGLGGILYGYDMGIIAAALVFVRTSFALSAEMQEFLVGAVLVGSMGGALWGGGVADHIGRRATLLWGAAIFLAGSLLAAVSPDAWMLGLARVLLGLAIGFTSVTAPVFVSELSPPQSRGRLIGLYQFALTAGIAMADLVGYWLAGAQGWRMMFALGAAPALLFLLLILRLPESPRWLMAKGRTVQAEHVLARYTDAAGAQLLLADIRAGLAARIESRWRALWTSAARRPLLVASGFTILQQVTGINTIIYYGPQIFSLAGIGTNRGAIFDTLLVALMNVAATVVGLLLVDRIGRKPLLYAGVTGMGISLFTLALAFHERAALGASLGLLATLCLMAYIVCFAASMGPIAWILVAELFPLRLRGRGVAAASFASGLSNLAVSLTFLSLIHAAGSSLTFSIYGVFCVLTLLFTGFVIPETKGHELESISAVPSSAI